MDMQYHHSKGSSPSITLYVACPLYIMVKFTPYHVTCISTFSLYTLIAMDFPPQEWFLYKGNWSPEIDSILVQTILRLKRETGWVLKEFPSYFVTTAAKEIQNARAVCFTDAEVLARLEFMHCRYRTFKQLLAQDGAYWELPDKKVVVQESGWMKICKENTLAGAYYFHHEPEYTNLACLFGMDDVKVEGETEVIVISETTEEVSSQDPSCYEVADGNEEVNSPTFVKPQTVRRKLFVDEDDPADRESTTDLGTYFIDVGEDGQVRTRLEKGRVLPKKHLVKQADDGPSIRASHASSCASNSPNGWWLHLKK